MPHLTDFAIIDSTSGFDPDGIEELIVSHADANALSLRLGHNLAGLVDIEREGLLDIDMNPFSQCIKGQSSVCVRGCRNVQDIGLRNVEHFTQIDERRRYAEPLGRLACEIDVRITNRDNSR